MRPRLGAPPGRPNAPAAPPRCPAGRRPGRPRKPPAGGTDPPRYGPPPPRRDRRSGFRSAAGAGRGTPGRGGALVRQQARRAWRHAAGDTPGRGARAGNAGTGTCGRGMGRSTGCAVENGLLPTRGVRIPAWVPGWAVARVSADVSRWETRREEPRTPRRLGCGRFSRLASGGFRGCGRYAAVTGGLVASAAALPLPAALSAAFSAAAFPPPKDSRSRRATGASTVDDADLTNSPCSLSRARTSLLVTPSSLANSCTRALPATTSPVHEATAVVGRASGLAMTHGHWDFTVCSCSLVPVLLRVSRAYSEIPSARPPRRCPVNRRCAALGRKLAAGSLPARIAGRDAAMHPARKATRWVNDHGVFAVPGRHSDHAKQFDGQLSLSAADTRSHRPIGAPMPARIGRRSLALDHGSVYRHRTVSQNHPAKLAHFKIVGVGQLRARGRGAVQVEHRGGGDVVMPGW
ncbi:translation initiation factor If-2 [Mycobacterium xenopi 3993]|nr:translation initiation factor If-2 [Mycobacterium xenopi 3993]